MKSFLIGLGLIFGSIILLSAIFTKFLKRNKKKESIVPGTGKTKWQIKRILEKGYRKIKSIEKHSEKIENESLRIKIDQICHSATKIYNNLKSNPEDINRARQFLNYYMETTEKIVDKYVALYKEKDRVENSEVVLQKTEKTFDTIQIAFDKQYSKLFDDDILNLDVEIEVLKKELSIEK